MIDNKEWWDVISVSRYDAFDANNHQTNKEKQRPCDSNGSAPRPKLSLKRNRSPHTTIYVELRGQVKAISIVDTNKAISVQKGGLARWEGDRLQFTRNIALPPINFIISKVEAVGSEAVAFIKRPPRESK